MTQEEPTERLKQNLSLARMAVNNNRKAQQHYADIFSQAQELLTDSIRYLTRIEDACKERGISVEQ